MPLTSRGEFIPAERMSASITTSRNIAARMERLGGRSHPARAAMLQEAAEYERALMEFYKEVSQ